MRRNPNNTSTHPGDTGSRIVSWLAAALSSIALIATAVPTAAQASAQCAAGLMRRDEAGTGTLLLKTTIPGCYLGAPRVAADITVDIAGPVARTRVTQRFENPSDGWVEGVYLFPLPEGAAVDTLRMQIGERFIEGEIKERQQARQIYEQARAEGRAASLVEQDRPNVFTNQVANIGPHQTVVVQIQYQESLRFDRDRYRLRVPLVVAPRYSPPPSIVVTPDISASSTPPVFPNGQTRRMSSPRRMVPPVITRALSPRIRWARPVGELIQRSASLPNRLLNLAHPVWGCSLTSMTEVPIASRVPAGSRSTLRSRST